MSSDNEYVGLSSFVGGESQDVKFGNKYQYDYGRHIDSRKNASGFTVLPATAKASGGVVTDLVQDMTQVPDGTRYALGDSGNIYKISTAGTWSKIGALGQAGGGGIVYRADNDMIYITGQTKVARISKVSTTPTLDVNWYQYGISTATTCYKTGGTNTYTLPTAVSETATNIRTFISDIEPLIRIGVKATTATGNWTMTLHDDANNLLGTVTVTAANLVVGQINYFTFTTPVRLFVSANNYTSSSSNGRTYHFHLTSTVATDAIATTTASSLADCDMELWANALVQPNNGLHPIYNFAQFTLIGNEKYVVAYEPLQDAPTTSDYQRHRLTFPPGYETNGIAQLDLYAGITTEQRSTSSTQDFQSGKLFLWDAVQTTYNRYYDIPEGSPESVFSHKNALFFIAGGALWESTGGQPVKLRTIRNMSGEYTSIADSTHVYPHMMTVRRGVLLVGYPSITTSTILEHVVYGYGQISNQFPMSWTTNHTMSTGTILNNGTNNLRLGMVKNYGDTLYLSWRDDSSGTTLYGVDTVTNSSAPYGDFQIQTLYFDNNEPYKESLAKKAMAVFDPLPSDGSVSLRMWYKVNNESTKHYSTDDGTAYVTSGNNVSITIPKQFIGLQVGLEGTITGNTTPFCRGIYIVFDPERGRDDIGS
jgi:hypothetical protein